MFTVMYRCHFIAGLVSKLSAEQTGLSEEVQSLQQQLHGVRVGDKVLQERLKRSEDLVANLKQELSLSQQTLDSSKQQSLHYTQEINR